MELIFLVPDFLCILSIANSRYVATFNKLHAWRLQQYDRVLYVDSDLLLLRPLQPLFRYPSFGAVPYAPLDTRFNSGVLLIGVCPVSDCFVLSFFQTLALYMVSDHFSWLYVL